MIKTPEPILPIQLIALDIDGTLVGEDLEIGPDTRAAVRAARSRGVIVSLVTGRMVSSAMHFARELELEFAGRRLPRRIGPRDAGGRLRPAWSPARPHADAGGGRPRDRGLDA